MVVEGMNEAGFHTQTRGLDMIFQIIFSLVYQMGAGFFDKFPNMIKALVGRSLYGRMETTYL